MKLDTNSLSKDKIESWFNKASAKTLSERNKYRDNFTAITLTCLTSYLAFSVALRDSEKTSFWLDISFSAQTLILGIVILNGFYNLYINVDLMNRQNQKQISLYNKMNEQNIIVEVDIFTNLKKHQSILIKLYNVICVLSVLSIVVYGLMTVWCCK